MLVRPNTKQTTLRCVRNTGCDMTIRFCPACGSILELVERFKLDGTPYMVWECPEQDFFDPLSLVAPEPENNAADTADSLDA